MLDGQRVVLGVVPSSYVRVTIFVRLTTFVIIAVRRCQLRRQCELELGHHCIRSRNGLTHYNPEK